MSTHLNRHTTNKLNITRLCFCTKNQNWKEGAISSEKVQQTKGKKVISKVCAKLKTQMNVLVKFPFSFSSVNLTNAIAYQLTTI